MDLHKIWADWQDTQAPSDIPIVNYQRGAAHSPIAAIRRGLLFNSIITAFFLVAAIGLIILYEHPYVRVCLIVLGLGYLSALLYTLHLYRHLPGQLPLDGQLLPTLRQYHRIVSRWLRINERVALWFYPVSVVAGFLIGLSIVRPVEAALQDRIVVFALIASLIILVPVSHWISRWMSRLAFGQYLGQLEDHIAVLEEVG